MSRESVRHPARADWEGTGRPPRTAVAILVAISLAINLAVVAVGGLRQGGESSRYLALCRLAGAGIVGVIGLQVAAAALVAVVQYELGRELGGRWAGAIAAGLLVANLDLARWHAYLRPDSLYTSMVVLATWGIHRASEGRSAWRYVGASALMALAAMLCLQGWILVPIAGAYWIGRTPMRPRVNHLAMTVLVLAFVLIAWAVLTLRRGTGMDRPDEALFESQVIGGHAESRIAMPGPPETTDGGWTAAAIRYARRHPGATLRLATVRVLAELAHVRPFYSLRHNLILLAYLPPLYALAAIGLILARREPLALLLAAVAAGHLLVVALTRADWDGRFLLYAMPAICVLAARALVGIRRWARLVFVLVLTALALATGHRPLLVGFAHLFRVDEPIPCDALVVLLGSESDRPEKAAELYRKGYAPVVLVGTDPDTEPNCRILIRDGVPAGAIHVLAGAVENTHDEARRIRDYARTHPMRRITIVTTSFHTARARRIFRKILKGTGIEVGVAASRDPRFDESDWYTKGAGIFDYLGEALKVGYSQVAY